MDAGKSRDIQLIKADLELIIIIFIRIRVERNVEEDKQISKLNYRLRNRYSIESVLLKKVNAVLYKNNWNQNSSY